MNIREAVVADAKAIQAIYAPYVEQTAVTFEYNVPSEGLQESGTFPPMRKEIRTLVRYDLDGEDNR